LEGGGDRAGGNGCWVCCKMGLKWKAKRMARKKLEKNGNGFDEI
jgi:hypothetical protein